MSKRTKETITLGSGKVFILPYSETLPTVEEICQNENLMGYIQGGCALEYTEETYEEKDDLGYVHKIITTKEKVLMKFGLITWNGKTLPLIISRCKSTEANGIRTTKIGGAGNHQGGYYAVCFFHEDKVDGNVWVMIKGRNTAGAKFNFATDSGSKLEPEFEAMPHDNDGTLVEMIEEIDATATASTTSEENPAADETENPSAE